MVSFHVRPFTADDAAAADELLRRGFGGFEALFPGVEEAIARGPLVLAQTGHRLLVVEGREPVAGLVRWWDEDGIAWLDLLTAGETGAGRALVREVERTAQQHGLRSARLRVPAADLLEEYFGRLGYLPVAGTADGGRILEKRLPLLTMRQQRRDDAGAIARLTGDDPWPFTQGSRPGWFVLADGERIAGALAVRDAGRGLGEVRTLVLDPGYAGRGLETWMLHRAALHAATAGFHTLGVPATPALRALRRELEGQRWQLDGDRFVRRLDDLPLDG